jgi:hypothetical protein
VRAAQGRCHSPSDSARVSSIARGEPDESYSFDESCDRRQCKSSSDCFCSHGDKSGGSSSVARSERWQFRGGVVWRFFCSHEVLEDRTPSRSGRAAESTSQDSGFGSLDHHAHGSEKRGIMTRLMQRACPIGSKCACRRTRERHEESSWQKPAGSLIECKWHVNSPGGIVLALANESWKLGAPPVKLVRQAGVKGWITVRLLYWQKVRLPEGW